MRASELFIVQYATKEKVELFSNRIAISPAILHSNPSNSPTLIQNALTSFKVLEITYHSEHKERRPSER